MSSNSTDFIFEYIPSFYRDMLKDNEGENLYSPIFTCMGNLYGDLYFQAKQISKTTVLETCPHFLTECFSSIDTSISNKYYFSENIIYSGATLNFGYLIDSEIVSINNIFKDSKLSLLLSNNNINFTIIHNTSTNEKIICFIKNINGIPTNIEIDQNTLFVDYIIKDKHILQNRWGLLLDYIPSHVLDYNQSFATKYVSGEIFYNYLKNIYDVYHKQLSAILILANFPTIEGIKKFTAIWNNVQYVLKDGIVLDPHTISNTDGTITTYTKLIKDSLITKNVKKYDILSDMNYIITDMYAHPDYFISILSTKIGDNQSVYDSILLSNESHDDLHYDSVIKFDSNFEFDMGQKRNDRGSFTGISNGSYPDYRFNNFSSNAIITYADQPSLKYEMFRNLIVFLYTINTINYLNDFKNIIRKYIPSYMKVAFIQKDDLT